MARTDSFSQSVWTNSAILTGAQTSGAVLVTSGALGEGWYLIGFIGSCDLAWVYRVVQYASNGTTVKHSQLYQPVAGSDSQFFPSPIVVAEGDIIKLELQANVSPVVGLQMSLFTQQMGGRPV